MFDYGEAEIGKPRGIDIKEKKMTLPLITALNRAEKGERRRIIKMIKNESEKPKKVREIIEFVRSSGGIEHTETVMKRYFDEALEILRNFPDSDYRQGLENLVRYTIERAK